MNSSDLDPGTKVLVLGAGSIGQRHARNLLACGAEVSVMDPLAERAALIEGVTALTYDLKGLDGFQGIVVASPTICHRSQTEAALASGARVMVEKPMDVTSQGIQSLLAAGQDRLMVGFNLRLHQPVQRLVSLVQSGRAGRLLSVRLWFGSYLPDWRPDIDYRSCYSASRQEGGGILLDAIHELDMALWLLDDRLNVTASIVARLGTLEIDVEDTVHALLRHAEGTVVDISLDYLSRRYRRGIEVIGSEATLRLDWARGVIEVDDASGTESEDASLPVARSYEREAQYFLAFVRGEVLPLVDGATGAASLRLADQIREAAS